MLEVIVQTKELTHALNFASSIVEKRNVISELNNIKLTTKSDSLEIGATDMDIYLNQTIGAKILSQGETTISSRTFADIIRKIPDSTLTLKHDKTSNKCLIIGKNCQFDLFTLSPLQFPILENIASDPHLKISCSNFSKIIEYSSFAISNDDTRYNLNGIYLHIKDNNLFSVATDGHRLSLSSCTPIEINNYSKFEVIIPKKTTNELLKITKDIFYYNHDAYVTLNHNKIQFTCRNLLIVSKIIDGTFPDYKTFIPNHNQNKLIIKTKLLADAIDRIATITVDKFRAIKLHIDNSLIKITAYGETTGKAEERLIYSEKKEEYCKFIGTKLVIGFNPRYLYDVLNIIKDPIVEIFLHDPFSPILIKSLNQVDNIFVIMPIRI